MIYPDPKQPFCSTATARRVKLEPKPGAGVAHAGVQFGQLVDGIGKDLSTRGVAVQTDRLVLSPDRLDLVYAAQVSEPPLLPVAEMLKGRHVWLGVNASNASRRALTVYVGTSVDPGGTDTNVVWARKTVGKMTSGKSPALLPVMAVSAWWELMVSLVMTESEDWDALVRPVGHADGLVLLTQGVTRGPVRHRMAWRHLEEEVAVWDAAWAPKPLGPGERLLPEEPDYLSVVEAFSRANRLTPAHRQMDVMAAFTGRLLAAAKNQPVDDLIAAD